MGFRIYHNSRLVKIEFMCFLSKTVRVSSFIFLWGPGVFMQFFSCNFGVFAPKRFKPNIFANFGGRTADSIASIKVHNFLNLGCIVSKNVLDFEIANVWVLEKLRQRSAWTNVIHYCSQSPDLVIFNLKFTVFWNTYYILEGFKGLIYTLALCFTNTALVLHVEMWNTLNTHDVFVMVFEVFQ